MFHTKGSTLEEAFFADNESKLVWRPALVACISNSQMIVDCSPPAWKSSARYENAARMNGWVGALLL